MVEGGGGTTFPVVFFDGETEINMGVIKIDPSLEYKAFQLLLSQRIGISPNQISTYLVDRKKSKSSSETRRRIPITAKANFSLISKEKDCFFLAVLKRTRKNRRSKPRPGGFELADYVPIEKFSPSPAENFLLLRRNQSPESNNKALAGYFPQYFHPNLPLNISDFKERLRDLEIQRQNYTKGLYLNTNRVSYLNLDLESFPKIEDNVRDSTPNLSLCEECRNANNSEGKSPAAFHWCVNDAITRGFRSPAGPISRPFKASG